MGYNPDNTSMKITWGKENHYKTSDLKMRPANNPKSRKDFKKILDEDSDEDDEKSVKGISEETDDSALGMEDQTKKKTPSSLFDLTSGKIASSGKSLASVKPGNPLDNSLASYGEFTESPLAEPDLIESPSATYTKLTTIDNKWTPGSKKLAPANNKLASNNKLPSAENIQELGLEENDPEENDLEENDVNFPPPKSQSGIPGLVSGEIKNNAANPPISSGDLKSNITNPKNNSKESMYPEAQNNEISTSAKGNIKALAPLEAKNSIQVIEALEIKNNIQASTSLETKNKIQENLASTDGILPLLDKDKFTTRFATEQTDLSYVNPLAATTNQQPSVNLSLSTEKAVIPVTNIQEIINQMVAKVTEMRNAGTTETVITLKYPPLFEGTTIVVTAFDSAKNEFNITIENLTQAAKQLLDQQDNKQNLLLALEQKGYAVHILTTTTLVENRPVDSSQEDPTGQQRNEQRQEGRKQRRGQEDET